MTKIKPKYILFFFSLVGFICGVNVMLSSLYNESPEELSFKLTTVLTVLLGGLLGAFGSRNTTCILFRGTVYEKIAFILIFIACLATSSNYYAPISTSIVLATLGFAVITGVLSGDFRGQDDSRCESFLKDRGIRK